MKITRTIKSALLRFTLPCAIVPLLFAGCASKDPKHVNPKLHIGDEIIIANSSLEINDVRKVSNITADGRFIQYTGWSSFRNVDDLEIHLVKCVEEARGTEKAEKSEKVEKKD